VQWTFSGGVGALTELRGAPAWTRYHGLLRLSGHHLVAIWNGIPVYLYVRGGENVFWFDHSPGVRALFILQGKDLTATLRIAHKLDERARARTLP
jgi:hypothetical protein